MNHICDDYVAKAWLHNIIAKGVHGTRKVIVDGIRALKQQYKRITNDSLPLR